MLPSSTVAFDPAAISTELLKDDEPRLCPAPGPDKAGGSEKGRDYEDYVKKFINPGNPTPRGWAFQLPNPTDNGEPVHFDDCQRSTGMVAEINGKYAGLLAFQQGEEAITEEWLDQSGRQVAARGWRRHRWYFAESETAAFAKKIFDATDEGRETIEIEVRPWPEQKQ